jgi:hypothetical protein
MISLQTTMCFIVVMKPRPIDDDPRQIDPGRDVCDMLRSCCFWPASHLRILVLKLARCDQRYTCGGTGAASDVVAVA